MATTTLEARLILAAVQGHVADMKKCLKADVDCEVRDDDGSTSLIVAAFKGHLPCVRLLCEQAGASLRVCNNTFHWDPVLAAAYAGHSEVVAYLLSRGASTCQVDIFGHTALDYARMEGHLDTEVILLRAGSPAGADVARQASRYAQIKPEDEDDAFEEEQQQAEQAPALPAATPQRSSRGAATTQSRNDANGGLSGRGAAAASMPALPASPAPGTAAFEEDARAAAAARLAATPNVRMPSRACDGEDASDDENAAASQLLSSSKADGGIKTRSGRTLSRPAVVASVAAPAVPPVPPTPAALKPRSGNAGYAASATGTAKAAVAQPDVVATPTTARDTPPVAAAAAITQGTPRSTAARVPIRGLVSPRTPHMPASLASRSSPGAAVSRPAAAHLPQSASVSMSLAAGGDDLTVLPFDAEHHDAIIGGRWVTRPSLRNAVVGWGMVAAVWLAGQAIAAATA